MRHSSLSHIYCLFFLQTLKSLELRGNQIGDLGAQYLADVLQGNTVGGYCFFILYINILIQTDTHEA
jgi:hypothetical protein